MPARAAIDTARTANCNYDISSRVARSVCVGNEWGGRLRDIVYVNAWVAAISNLLGSSVLPSCY